MIVRYEFHPEASIEVEEIWEYIARDSPTAADEVLAAMEAAIGKAAAFPELGHLRPDLTSQPLRFLHVYDYLIAYAVEEDRLWVVAVLHGRRNPRVLSRLLASR